MLFTLGQTSQATLLPSILFWIFAGFSAAGAVGVVVSRNIVRTAIALLFTLLGVAGLYFLLNAEFLAAVQLVVFVGGTLILIIFGVMLTSKSPFSRFEPRRFEVIVALVLGSIIFFALTAGIVSTHLRIDPVESGQYPIVRLGQAFLGDYLVPFELVSVLLLVVMIGAAYLSKARRTPPAKPRGADLSATMRKWS